MSNYNQNDNRNQGPSDQFEQSAGGEQEFVYAEEKKPLNRNMVVLLLIAVVGASLIYLMYLRSRFSADQQTPEQVQASAAVESFIKDGAGSIDQMEAQLAKTEKEVAIFQQDNSIGQIPPEELKVNPFSFGNPNATKTAEPSAQVPQATPSDPGDPVRQAAAKAKIQMILYSTTNSSVTINNWVYKTGDRIVLDTVPFTIKSITAGSVTLSHPIGEFLLSAPGTQGM